MTQKKNNRTWLALLLLFVIFFVSSQEYEGLAFLQDAPRIIKNSFNYVLLILVAFTGYFGFSRHPQKWIKKVWLVLYAIVFALLTIFGLADILLGYLNSNSKVGFTNLNVRSFFREFRVFFAGPFPFVILLLLNRLIESTVKKNQHGISE